MYNSGLPGRNVWALETGRTVYGGMADDTKAAFAALNSKDYKGAAKSAEAALKSNYMDMEAHVAASSAYKGLGDTAKSDFHRAVYLGLVNSILDSGDGKTPDTAYVVISTHEEYIALRALGLTFQGQALNNAKDHTFDVMTCVNPETKESFKVYFNIDISWAAETKMFSKP